MGLEDISSFAGAVMILPVKEKSEIADTDNTRVLRSVTRRRWFWFGFIVLLQAFVAAILGLCGLWYLTYTTIIQDLLLNAAALNIILDLDELIFWALAPDHARRIIMSLQPLPQPRPRRFGGCSLWSLFSMVALATVIGASIHFLQSQGEVLREAKLAVCGGNLDFVATVDRSGVVIAHEPRVSTEFSDSYEFRAIRQLIDNTGVSQFQLAENGSLSTVAGGISGSTFSLNERHRMSTAETAGVWNSQCIDSLSEAGRQAYGKRVEVFLEILREASGIFVESCSDVAPFCSWDSVAGVRARQVCPVTCGCDDPGSSLVFTNVNNGCPPRCVEMTRYMNAVQSRDCQDLPLDSPYWANYLQGIQGLMMSYPDTWRKDLIIMMDAIKSRGCGVALDGSVSTDKMQWPWDDTCGLSLTWFLKPLAYACPVSCKCSQPHTALNLRPYCPETCWP